MLEYVLFHEKPFTLFCEFLQNQSLLFRSCSNDGMYEIAISEDTPEDQIDIIEAEYDRLMQMNQELFFAENKSAKDNYRMATIMVELKDGTYSSAHIRPDLLGQVMEVLSDEELNEFVKSIADAVENPDDRTYCQKVRSGEIEFDEG